MDSHQTKILILHSIIPVLDSCGNSYANAYIEELLTKAKELEIYQGRTTGKINKLKQEFEEWLENNNGLPEL